MITIDNNFLMGVPLASIVTENDGEILCMNTEAIDFLQKHKLSSISMISDLSIDLSSIPSNEKDEYKCSIFLSGFPVSVKVFNINYEGNDECYLFILNNLKYKVEEQKRIFDSIDASVTVIDDDMNIEETNSIIYELAGSIPDNIIGMNIEDLLKNEYLSDSIAYKVLKSKRKENLMVDYTTGKTLTLTGIPILNNNKKIAKIVITSRDITKLIELEERLKKAEAEKNEYKTKLQELEEFIGKSKFIYSSNKMKRLIYIAIKSAKTDSSVFIWGESGVGKEVMASFIHDNSLRKDKPFIAINCAAIPGELLESQFFGYEDGAFTGAKKHGKRGIFEEADGGTVFLDEIGELPYNMQSKLLRVIQENRIMRVGGSETIAIDVRFIAATNLTNEQLTDNNRFRQDLYYRLSVIPINIPPLRERREDIFPLVHHFIKHFNSKYDKNVSICKNVMNDLYNYNWNGNIRELKNMIERLVILAENDIINSEEFKMLIKLKDDNKESNCDNHINIKIMPMKSAYRILEGAMIKMAIKETSNIVEAAKLLEMAPATIYRRIKDGVIEI